jgi:hypothetical protein
MDFGILFISVAILILAIQAEDLIRAFKCKDKKEFNKEKK